MKHTPEYLEAKKQIQIKHRTKWLFMLIIAGCLGLMFLSSGCGNYETYTPKITVREGCEYYASNGIFTHKGNCKNPIHQTIIHDTVWFVKADGKNIEINLKK